MAPVPRPPVDPAAGLPAVGLPAVVPGALPAARADAPGAGRAADVARA
ncbi:MAG TPA: hypothetical protein VK233_06640 [Candidatus Dormibacteraeota bacterium]|nr:hypothetical protein [Candidatus Dormibacteraeota bacterium]